MPDRVKNPPYPKWWFVALICSIALCVVGLAGCSGASTPTAASATPTPAPSVSEPEHHHEIEVAPAATLAADAGVPHIGDPVQVGNLEFTVTHATGDITKISGTDEFSIEAEGAYTIVDVTVTNTGHHPQRYFAEYATGIASDGHEISSEMVATSYLNEEDDAWLAELAPGQSVVTVIAFDVEDGETLTAVVLRDVDTSHGATVSL